MIKQRIISVQVKKSSDRNKPKVIKWKGITMVRNHSFLATIKEIVTYSEEMDVVRIGIIGDMMSGKTTLSQSIAHGIHTMSKIPYAVRIFYKKDLIDFVNTLKDLTPTNYVLIFDDVSFLKATATNKQINSIEQAITTIRHMDGGQDVKIIVIFNYHYPKALPPFLREAQFKYITSIGDANEKNIADTYGKNNVDMVVNFKMMRKKAINDKMWFEKIGPKDPIRYDWRNPFIPVLFWNESSLRKIISPTRHFMDLICSTCDGAEGIKTYDEKTLPEIVAQGEKSNGRGNFMAAVKLLMYVNGMTGYGTRIIQTLKWIERERKMRNIPLEAFAVACGITVTSARLRAKSYDESVQDKNKE